MDWVKEFYRKQNQLSKECYSSEVEDYHKDKVSIISKYHDSNKRIRILDLGSGGGQHAAAMAMLDNTEVVAVELLEELCSHTKDLKQKHHLNNLTIICEDFYRLQFKQEFDIVTYYDGFGIGDDEDQRKLLKLISSWLKPESGRAFIEVYTSWFALSSSLRPVDIFRDVRRQYSYDFANNRLEDSWWSETKDNKRVTQTLRSYTPPDFRLLLEGTGLKEEFSIPCMAQADEWCYPKGDCWCKAITFMSSLSHL
ncbi:MAG: class I SAM-dependent methyltransferase [Oligoflexia bacterium]|nr:class I SAM-dependent methyltransferase [Oligoflexia bacterium]